MPVPFSVVGLLSLYSGRLNNCSRDHLAAELTIFTN